MRDEILRVRNHYCRRRGVYSLSALRGHFVDECQILVRSGIAVAGGASLSCRISFANNEFASPLFLIFPLPGTA